MLSSLRLTIRPLVRLLIVSSIGFLFLSGCGGSSDNGVQLRGFGELPADVAPETDNKTMNAPYEVLDLSKPADQRVVATGTTDTNGFYDVDIDKAEGVAVVIHSRVRVSGLIDSDPSTKMVIIKTFNGATDIACEAGVTAVDQGAITAAELTVERITNMEAVANAMINADLVNFNDPASVTAAAAEVRRLTNDGAVLPTTPAG